MGMEDERRDLFGPPSIALAQGQTPPVDA